MAVQVLRLLQEDVVEDAGDVDGHIVLYRLQHRHVGSDAGQQLAGLGYLLSSLVVHRHPNYGPGGRGLRVRGLRVRGLKVRRLKVRGLTGDGCEQHRL